jgi:hypothetical protein
MKEAVLPAVLPAWRRRVQPAVRHGWVRQKSLKTSSNTVSNPHLLSLIPLCDLLSIFCRAIAADGGFSPLQRR